MLTTQGIYELEHGQLVIGKSVPFSFRAYDGILAAPALYFLGTETSLLELKIHKRLFAVVSVTLTLYNRPLLMGVPTCYTQVEIVEGLPIVSIEDFSHTPRDEHRRMDEDCDFELHRFENNYLAVFDSKIVPERCFRTDRIRFYEGQGMLCAIGFFDLSANEIGILGHFLNLA